MIRMAINGYIRDEQIITHVKGFFYTLSRLEYDSKIMTPLTMSTIAQNVMKILYIILYTTQSITQMADADIVSDN